MDNLNNTLKVRDAHLNELIIKETELSRNNETLNKRIDSFVRERDGNTEELNQKIRELNDLKNRASYLETNLADKEKALISSEDNRRSLQNEYRENAHKADDYQRKFEKVCDLYLYRLLLSWIERSRITMTLLIIFI
jgi:uncharacterized coiled-coil DUF342 family protein